MRRTEHHGHFFTDPSLITEATLTIVGPDAHHLQVRRARPGDLIHVGNGAGRLVEAVIEDVSATKVSAAVLKSTFVERPATKLTVLQGLAKSGKVDWVVEKLVELGVDEVVVFAAGRSVPVWDAGKAEAMRARWDRVAYAAAKQSQRAWMPVVTGPLDRSSLLLRVWALPATLVADPESNSSLRAVLMDLTPVPEVAIVVGPEGGLSREEVGQLIDAGAQTVSLGAQILRTETAGLALSAVLMHHLDRFG